VICKKGNSLLKMAVFYQKTDVVVRLWENVEAVWVKSPRQCRKVGRRQKKTARRERISPGGSTFLSSVLGG